MEILEILGLQRPPWGGHGGGVAALACLGQAQWAQQGWRQLHCLPGRLPQVAPPVGGLGTTKEVLGNYGGPRLYHRSRF